LGVADYLLNGANWSLIEKGVDANSLKDMVGPCGLEPQTSTVSIENWLRRLRRADGRSFGKLDKSEDPQPKSGFLITPSVMSGWNKEEIPSLLVRQSANDNEYPSGWNLKN